MADPLFTQLLPFEWRAGERQSVLFPCSTMRISLQQEHATHGVWGQDVERIEATGRKGLVFTAKIPFRNGIVPGKRERWGVLYPDAYRAFIVATANRSSGMLVHPELGQVYCKVQSVESDWDAAKRDGCDVDVTWVETRRNDDSDFEEFADTPVTEASIAAFDLDVEKFAISPPLPDQKRFATSFTDLMRSVASVGDQVSLMAYRTAGKADSILASVDAIEEASLRPGKTAASVVRRGSNRVRDRGDDFKRAVDFVRDPNVTDAAEACLRWPVRQQVAALRVALADVRKKLLEDGGTVVFYTVPKPTTLGGLVATTGASVSDLMALNPALVRRPIVPRNTMVRYYADAA